MPTRGSDPKSSPRWFLLFGLVPLLVAVAGRFAPAEDSLPLPVLVKRVFPSVVVIETFDKQMKALGRGSGFFVGSPPQVLTNWHVVKGAHRVVVKTADGRRLSVGDGESFDDRADLVLLPVMEASSGIKPLALANLCRID